MVTADDKAGWGIVGPKNRVAALGVSRLRGALGGRGGCIVSGGRVTAALILRRGAGDPLSDEDEPGEARPRYDMDPAAGKAMCELRRGR